MSFQVYLSIKVVEMGELKIEKYKIGLLFALSESPSIYPAG
jgi:hypothetical protein